jgi:hypothetical protein
MQQIVRPQDKAKLHDAENEENNRQRHQGEFYRRCAAIVFE